MRQPKRRDPAWPLPPAPDAAAIAAYNRGEEAGARALEWQAPYRELITAIEVAELDEGRELFREACTNDFWFFCRYCLTLGRLLCKDPGSPHFGKPWLDHPWVYARCREIQASPDGHLDLWPRFHLKTALITQSLTLWDLIDDPELKIGLFTYKLDTVGEGFMSLLKRELEVNEKLHDHFPYVFFRDPQRESPEWTATSLVVRREGNPKEPSIMAIGIIGNLPTSFHFDIHVYDDMVIEKAVSTPEMIASTTQAFRNCGGLGEDWTVTRGVGTHWRANDSWQQLYEAGVFVLRYHDLYLEDGETPVMRSQAWVDDWHRRMGSYNYWAQMRNKPQAGSGQTFHVHWLEYYDSKPDDLVPTLNVYLLLDSARMKKKANDYSCAAVVGVGAGIPAPHFFVLDMVRDRIGLVETTDLLFELVERWRPLCTFCEHFGVQRDIEHYRYVMQERGFRFRIRDMKEQIPKEERIRRLQPVAEAGRLHLPRELWRTSEGRSVDMVKLFVANEYRDWSPEGGAKHDDMLDTLAWLVSPVLKRYIKAPDAGQWRPAGLNGELDYLQQAQLERQRVVGGIVSGWSM